MSCEKGDTPPACEERAMALSRKARRPSSSEEFERKLAFAVAWAQEAGVVPRLEQRILRRKLADTFADGFAAAQLIYTARPDLLDLHAFEPGREEAQRNWRLLREALSRLELLDVASEDVVRTWTHGKDAKKRADSAATFLVALRQTLKRSRQVKKEKTSLVTTASERKKLTEAELERRYSEILKSSGNKETLDELEKKSRDFDRNMAKLRHENLRALEATERTLARLQVASTDDDDDFDDPHHPPPPPKTPPPPHHFKILSSTSSGSSHETFPSSSILSS